METINEMCELTPPCRCDCEPDKDLSQGNIRPNYSPSPCGADGGVCGEHILEHPLHLWAIKYGVEGHLKFIGVAVVQAPTRSAAECIFAKNSLFSGTPERLKILAMKEVMPWSEPILFEDCAAIIDKRNLKSYPFLLKSDYEHNIQNISDNVIEAVEDYIEHNPIQQVQSNWEETDETSKAYILNKPEIPDAQVQADWNETNESSKAFIQNKPEIPAEQVNADWESESGKSQILNKPTDLVHTSDIEGLLRNDGSVYTGKYLEQVRDLDNFQASEGKIVQYIGETNSKYTNGYVYKKVETSIVIPAGTNYIQVSYDSNRLKLGDVGIENGIYYKTDKKDEVTSNIRDFFLQNCTINSEGMVTVSYETTSTYPIYRVQNVYAFYRRNNHLYFDKVVNATYNIVQNEFVPYDITFMDDTKIRSTFLFFVGHEFSGVGNGEPIPESKIIIFENIYGQKIYCIETRSGNTSFKYKLLVLNNMGDYYQVANPDNYNYHSEYFSNGTTTEEQTIGGITKWQQWDVQPRDDTSHFVTDSEIGWIEH